MQKRNSLGVKPSEKFYKILFVGGFLAVLLYYFFCLHQDVDKITATLLSNRHMPNEQIEDWKKDVPTKTRDRSSGI